MSGIRTYTTLDPNVFRYPQWKDNTYYPAGSIVAVGTPNPSDSEQSVFSYYVSALDIDYDNKIDSLGSVIVNSGSWAPNDSDSDWGNHSKYGVNPWALAFDTTQSVIDAALIAQINALSALFPLLGIDSDIAILFRADSDFTVRDSELDSDIKMEIHDRKGGDSDLLVIINDLDSELRRQLDSEIHNRKAADSDLNVRVDSEIHDRKAADSDLQVQIWDNDSDILMEIHDRKAADSDQLVFIAARIDSDSDRLTNFIHRYEQRDSDLELKFIQHDSDINWLRDNMAVGVEAGQSNGFPVGAIVPFAHNNLPIGFHECDGSTFNSATYLELFQALGTNILPDFRNQFLRGFNNDSDGFGNARGLLTTQEDELRSHQHSIPRDLGGAGGTGGDTGNSATTLRFTNFTGGDETRPTNVSVVYAIAMYSGAGIIVDSDLLTGIIAVKLKDYDSDLEMLYSRTNYHREFWPADSDTPVGYIYTAGADTSIFEDIAILLNGVQVTQWSASGNQIVFNFALRKGIDEVTLIFRR